MFYNLIKNQFGKTVKVFRSDNGTEFVNNKMVQFCKSLGIVHQTSCSYTPQQNRIVERKHGHLLNVARSLLFHGGIPLFLWSESVLTATYFINRTPSSVLRGKTPYEMVYGDKPVLKHLRNFGCLCFARNLNNSDKFGSRAEKCVLIGYSGFKKGYKLYSLENKAVLFSRDVKFYENVFLFTMTNKTVSKVSGESTLDLSVTHLNFFDTPHNESYPSSKPNDEEEGTSQGDGSESEILGRLNKSSGTSDWADTSNVDISNENDPPEGTINNNDSVFLNSQDTSHISSNSDDIVVTGNDESEINNIKPILSSIFMIKDLGKLKYFLGI